MVGDPAWSWLPLSYNASRETFHVRITSNPLAWDKAATIHFKKPGRGTLHACCKIDEAEIAAIKQALETQKSVDRNYTLELVDDNGVVHVTVEKVIYVRKHKEPEQVDASARSRQDG